MLKSLLPCIHVKNINNFINDSGKMDLVYNLMMKLRREKRKVLIFTQMTKMLNLLERLLAAKGFTYVRLDGSVPAEKRQVIVQTFNKNPKIMVFISSTRVGGVGINLTSADTVIFYDNDWNPAVDRQAQDRCHRIGQSRDVTVYRLVTEFTIEENILTTSNLKAKMDDLVLNKGQFNLLKLFQSRGHRSSVKVNTPIQGSSEDVFQEESQRRLTQYLDLVEEDEDKIQGDQDPLSDISSQASSQSENSQNDFSDVEEGSGDFHNRVIQQMIPQVWRFGTNYLESIFETEVLEKGAKDPAKLEVNTTKGDISKTNQLPLKKKSLEFLNENEKSKIEIEDRRYKEIMQKVKFDLSEQESKILIQELRKQLK